MPRQPTLNELANEWRVIPAYSDYEVTFVGKVRNKTSKLIVIPFMIDYKEHLGIHVNLFVQGVRETIDVWSLVQNAFKE
ncbi:hypothetical protein PP914_gp144 [Arthrobacter phage Qui]|uniref:Uncharacterized protein n=1 Tax=Arthrobacter phage Qui TaxID=2603260 RepID=A0A5B8WGK7_9CAUD|nr:hypothetical protein PP914_gp144 [Arthrobacter phage Qui]QED11633.1 hypothetical protein SEA_QUI_144 [Arthrobacter phage Qui]QOC56465.1 hypothetical protein SEA_PAELLA_144 [Arthrobacter phage Paella]